VQCDEVWGFVNCKEKTRLRLGHAEDRGDCYTFTAIEKTSKLMLCWHVGKRSPEGTLAFAAKLKTATSGRFQLSTDGYTPYRVAMPITFGSRVDFAQLVKVYGKPAEGAQRYSPAEVIGTTTNVMSGHPDPGSICTSHVERLNLSIRMAVRRMTRLTNAFSKKWRNHEAAMALFLTYYNFCRVHLTLKTTRAGAASLSDHVWSVRELLERVSERLTA
jgi:IS1 family transposase